MVATPAVSVVLTFFGAIGLSGASRWSGRGHQHLRLRRLRQPDPSGVQPPKASPTSPPMPTTTPIAWWRSAGEPCCRSCDRVRSGPAPRSSPDLGALWPAQARS